MRSTAWRRSSWSWPRASLTNKVNFVLRAGGDRGTPNVAAMDAALLMRGKALVSIKQLRLRIAMITEQQKG